MGFRSPIAMKLAHLSFRAVAAATGICFFCSFSAKSRSLASLGMTLVGGPTHAQRHEDLVRSDHRSCVERHGFPAGASRVAQSFAFQTLRFFPKQSFELAEHLMSLMVFLLAQGGGVRPTS